MLSRTTLLAVVALVAVLSVVSVVAYATLRTAPAGTPVPGGEATGTVGSADSTAAADVGDGAAAPAAPAAGSLRIPTGIVATPQPRAKTPLRAFDVKAALAHIRALEAFGVRAGGSDAERQAALYIRDRLVALGLEARIEEFPISNGTTSRNVIARVKGSSGAVIVLGAHMDSKPPSPGANDNGSGCGALLEIAAILADEPVAPTVEFVFFGSEEIIGGVSTDHHFGSRFRVSQMSAAERANTAGMFSVDMIGFGPNFHSRNTGRAPMTISDGILAQAAASGIAMTYLKDTSATGLSDHEAYEKAGIPATCVCWRQDPVYHTADDVTSHLTSANIQTAGTVVLEYLRSLDSATLAALLAR